MCELEGVCFEETNRKGKRKKRGERIRIKRKRVREKLMKKGGNQN